MKLGFQLGQVGRWCYCIVTEETVGKERVLGDDERLNLGHVESEVCTSCLS